mgnify:CR=1 FL=1
MNFLKNSIFSRSSNGDGSGWEPENENQMLAVWGSPGSGKTTVAVKLAARLALQKRDVALLLCDMNTPMLPCICHREIWRKNIPLAVSWRQPMCRNPWCGITASPISGSAT